MGRFEITVTGEAAHAGLDPEEGASAILELSYLIQALFAINDPARGTTVNVGTIDGGLRPNVIAPQSSAMVDVRVPTQEDALHVEETILGLKPVTPGVTLRVEGGMGRPPMERTPRNRRLWETARELGKSWVWTSRRAWPAGFGREHHQPLYRHPGRIGGCRRRCPLYPRVRVHGQNGREVRPAGAATDGATIRGKETPMKPRYFFTSLTRISDLPEIPFSVEPLSQAGVGDGRLRRGGGRLTPNRLSRIELSNGRMVEVVEGDLIVGAFGVRYATLETVGGWQGMGTTR